MKKILAIVAAFAVVGFNGFMLMEGGIAGAQESQAWVVELEVTDELAYTCDDHGATTTLLSAIPGMTGGTATGESMCNVETNNNDGWQVTIEADNAGKMVSAELNEIAAYPTTTPEAWVLDDTYASYYGYFASSSYPETNYGFDLYRDLTSSAEVVATNGDETTTDGEDIVFGFKVEIGADANQATGWYYSNVTSTASLL